MSIDEEALRRAFAELKSRIDYLETASGVFAPDASLDRPKGNPKVKFAPRDWRGPNFVGKNYSQCSPEFLEVLASTLCWMADNPQEGKEKFAGLNRSDARRARSWARRIRAKASAVAPPPQRPSDPPPHAPPPSQPLAADLFDEETGEVFDQSSHVFGRDDEGNDLFGRDEDDDLFEESDHG